MPTCTDICSFMNKALTAKAVVCVCDMKLHRAAEFFSLDLGFDVKSCNWCEAAWPARINFTKSINTVAFISTDLFLYLTIKIFWIDSGIRI